MTAPSWWTHIHGKDEVDEDDYVAALTAMRQQVADYSHHDLFEDTDDVTRWVDLFAAAVAAVCNHGHLSPELRRLHEAVVALTVQTRPLPPDPMDALARRHRIWSDKADHDAARWD